MLEDLGYEKATTTETRKHSWSKVGDDGMQQ